MSDNVFPSRAAGFYEFVRGPISPVDITAVLFQDLGDL